MKKTSKVLLLFILPLICGNSFGQQLAKKSTEQQVSQMTNNSGISGHFNVEMIAPANTVNYTISRFSANSLNMQVDAKNAMLFMATIWDVKGNHVNWCPKVKDRSYNDVVDISSLASGVLSVYFFCESTSSQLFSTTVQ